MKKKFYKIFLYFNFALIFITLCAYLSPYANPKYLWPVSVIAVFYPWLLLGNLLFIIFWISYKFRFAAFSVLTIILGYNYLLGFIGINSAGYQSSPDQIEIMSYNTQNLYYIFASLDHKENRTKEFFDFLEEHQNVDIICTQEMGPRSISLWNKHTNFPHAFAPAEMGPVIFSKHPITNSGQIHSSTSTVNSCIWADVQISGHSYRIYNLHMQSNKITRTAEKVMDDPNLQDRETWSEIKSIIKRYKDNAAFRIEHAERITQHMIESPYPIILAGDFNDVPLSYLKRILSFQLNDSFRKKGMGFGITFNGKIPALRIDYILTDQDLTILQHRILRNDFSDHYAIKSIVKPKEGT